MTENRQSPAPRSRNDAVVVGVCLAFVGGMIGMSYAAVPLYDMFCRVTGYNGTTQRVEQVSTTILDRKMTVTFDANVAPGLPWEFKPLQREVTLRIGETAQVEFEAKNTSDVPTTGQAIFNVTPMVAGAYFNKVQCFCFNETELKPGETLKMPVVFYIDPDIVNTPETNNIGTLTLSYTFYPRENAKPVALRSGTDGAETNKL
ncbi:MAG: cytochrome c oxidase assembly protein [Rhizobiales bacterium 63-7]|uniref:cytochrome c oxidase assembly protein n=1 Tax=Rhizobium sp. YJ-22 TaxID=3037556 RepID=UPI00092CC0FA|nr:cytochrome c oxidase assembly protein [Rhizobium sp. YJ-22]MBN9029147.1 cytochrome c oxidase assembly protein [Hyphomicrobiales bacterium]MDG3574974.1 cytochrome c oxidase assembly protein [Rhizobium sp. YJ-22]OJU66787.1 MAG: cytochrome c oxidase assembly protein [Rhizobiales bacterium 63-7]